MKDRNNSLVIKHPFLFIILLCSSIPAQDIQYNEEFQVNTYMKYDQTNPDISSLSNGCFVICWNSRGQDGSQEGVYAQIYNTNGTKQGGEFRVNTVTASVQKYKCLEKVRNTVKEKSLTYDDFTE